MYKVLVGSPIRQNSKILKEFLLSFDELYKDTNQIDYCFVDDNIDIESRELLQNFKKSHQNVTIFDSDDRYLNYHCDDYTHRWNEDLVQKVTRFKNKIIDFAKENEYDYLFFIDSDIVLHPKTLTKLIEDDKEIVANIFWTKWNPSTDELPQVWLKDSYTLYDARANQNITNNEVAVQTRAFLDKMRKPGVYKVGGLGACTLISKSALNKGVNFDHVYNISFWGEDRHFCIRAAVLGIELYVDTYYPAYHIYREDDLAGVSAYKESQKKRDIEILGSKILDIIIDGVQSLNTYSYKEEVSRDFSKYFTTKEFVKQLESLHRNRKNVIKNNIINRAQVTKCTMTFYNNNTKVIASVDVNFNGYKNFYSFQNSYKTTVTLLMQDDGTFLIDEFIINELTPQNNIPLVRKVSPNPKLTLSMIVRNEENRYLKEVLNSCRQYIDSAVIIDDCSTDNTIEICKELLRGIPLKIIENETSSFNNETNLRKQQWYETISTNPDWILFLDADEIFEDKFKDEVKNLMNDFDTDAYLFRLYDFWSETHFRDDKLWCAHNTYRPFMIRYQKNFNYTFRETSQHCGRMPENVLSLSYKIDNNRLKHFGWAKEEYRVEKYRRYLELDPKGEFGSMEQYKSILDERPKLAKWHELESF